METHLKGFGLENFRVFKDYTWFDFAPITILTGPNSSGKSSLNKALLLLKDNFEKGNLPPSFEHLWDGYGSPDSKIFNTRDGEVEQEYDVEYEASTLRFDGKSHELGNLYSTKCRSSTSDIISFTIPYIINVNRSFNWNEIEEIFQEPFNPDEDFMVNLIQNGYTSSEKIKTEMIDGIKNNKGFNRLKIFYQFKSTGDRVILCKYTFQADKEAKTLSQLELQTDKGVTFLKISDKSVFFDLEIYDNLIINSENKFLNKFESYEKFIYANHQIGLNHWFLMNGLTKEDAEKYEKRALSILNIRLVAMKL